jgi:tetratricopeptide (TPR) repeat protein
MMTTRDDGDDRRWLTARDEAVRFLGQWNYEEVVNALKDVATEDRSGESQALRGLAHFHLEQYDLAASCYKAALERDPANKDWQMMRDVAAENATARIDVRVPEVSYFQRAQLLAAPVIALGVLPTPPPPPPPHGLRTRLRLIAGESLGRVACVGVDIITQVMGRVPGYHGRVWTNWDRRGYLTGLLILAYMREQLNKHNLMDTYPTGALTAYQPEDLTPPVGVTHFRTANGTWNNLSNPKEGAAGTRFLRNVTNEAARPESAERLLDPNPRLISRVLLTRKEPMAEVPFLNMLAAAWINFENHDWIHHGETLADDTLDIPLDEDDPIRIRHWQTKMVVQKTQPDPTYSNGSEETPITFINEVTHWWDGSQVYGSDQETVDRLRSGAGGKLRLTAEGTLPLDEHGVEEAGFKRNWWVGLAMLHTLFAREHNAICDHLHEAYPDWDDNRLFNVARLINAAVMAKIHTLEWTPAILPNRMVDGGVNANWYGLLTNIFKVGKKRKTLAKVNVRNLEMGGAVGNPVNRHGAPFGLTEEFVEVYRLHPLLPETLRIRRIAGDAAEDIPFGEVRQAGSPALTARVGMADMFFSFGNQHPGQLILNNYPRFMQEMSVPGSPLIDLGAIEVLRARERGVPRYNEFRRQLRLKPIASFRDLTDVEELTGRLEEVYGARPQDVEKLDLLIGTLAEDQTRRPAKFGFGETLFQIFILNATRRLQADRFYTDSYNEETYTREGLEWIDQTEFKDVLLRHYPELAQTGLANVKNAFEPWDADERLDPVRHPLREYDRELRPDPWLGDRARLQR